jgi:lipoyl(octanoyl) transferase
MTSTISRFTPVITDRPTVPGSRIPAELLWISSPVHYPDAWALQVRLHRERVMDARPDTVLLLEHEPVYTVGRHTPATDWGGDLSAQHRKGIEIQHVNRGGAATYHGPGQLVIYPILRLTDRVRGVRAYVERLEEAVIHCLREHGIAGQRKEKTPGVWVADPWEAKIASIGIRVDRGVTMHGIALNVDMDLSPFQEIIPCALQGCRITSMAEVVNRPLSMMGVTHSLLNQLQQMLALDWTGPPAPIEFRSLAGS